MNNKLKALVISRDGITCSYCGIKTKPSGSRPDSLVIEHMTKSRSENPSHLCICCRRCNSKKGDLSIYEYLGKIETAINEAEALKAKRLHILNAIHKMKEREKSCL